MNKLREFMGWVRGLKNAPRRFWLWHIASAFRSFLPYGEGGQAVVGMMFLITFSLVVVGGFTTVYVNTTRNSDHASVSHSTADMARQNIDVNNVRTSLYFSARRGTILAIAKDVDTNQCAGIVWRVTELNGSRWIGTDCYECTAFMAPCKYWNRVIRRDRYIPLWGYPDIKRLFYEWMIVINGSD